jgi:hypothetical protein
MIDYFYLGNYDPEATVMEVSRDQGIEDTQRDVETIKDAELHEGATAGQLAELSTDREADPDVNTLSNPEGMTIIPKKSRKKKQTAVFRELSPLPSGTELTAVTNPTTSFFTVHAKVYSMAAKYNIPALRRAALDKLRYESTDTWDSRDLVDAIDVVYNQTADNETEMRNALSTLILENTQVLLSDPGFAGAVEAVDGLAFELFRRMGVLIHGQKVCKRCGLLFVSLCASKGCGSTSLGVYNNGHICDLGGPCRDCQSKKRFF